MDTGIESQATESGFPEDADHAGLDAAKVVESLEPSARVEVIREMMMTGPVQDPVRRVINATHISDAIGLASRQDDHAFEIAKGEQR